MGYEFYPCHRSGMSNIGMTKNPGNKDNLFAEEFGGWRHLVRVCGGCQLIEDDGLDKPSLIIIEIDPEKELR